LLTYMLGPRFNWRHSRLTPYAQFLFGGGYVWSGPTHSTTQNASLLRPVVAWIVAGAERISYHQLCCNEYRSNESNQIEKAVCREASTCDLVTSYSSSEITPLMAENCPLLPQFRYVEHVIQ